MPSVSCVGARPGSSKLGGFPSSGGSSSLKDEGRLGSNHVRISRRLQRAAGVPRGGGRTRGGRLSSERVLGVFASERVLEVGHNKSIGRCI